MAVARDWRGGWEVMVRGAKFQSRRMRKSQRSTVWQAQCLQLRTLYRVLKILLRG